MYQPYLWAGKESEKARRNTGRADALGLRSTEEPSADFQLLRMIRIVPEEGVKERFGRRLLAAHALDGDNTASISASCLDRRIASPIDDWFRCPCIEFPGSRQRLLSCAVSFWPILERVGIHNPALVIEIESIEMRDLPGYKTPGRRFFRAAAAINTKTSAM